MKGSSIIFSLKGRLPPFLSHIKFTHTSENFAQSAPQPLKIYTWGGFEERASIIFKSRPPPLLSHIKCTFSPPYNLLLSKYSSIHSPLLYEKHSSPHTWFELCCYTSHRRKIVTTAFSEAPENQSLRRCIHITLTSPYCCWSF